MRRVIRCPSRYSSSGTANFRDRPVSSLNSRTPSRGLTCFKRRTFLDQRADGRRIHEGVVGHLHQHLLVDQRLDDLASPARVRARLADNLVGRRRLQPERAVALLELVRIRASSSPSVTVR